MLGQHALDEMFLYLIETHLFETQTAWGRGEAQAEVGATNHRSGREKDGALDSVIEFADVSGPGMFAEGLQRAIVEAGDFLAVALGIDAEEMIGEQFNISLALAESRKTDFDRIQA